MKIALDYDETFTADPSFWRDFIDRAELNDHEVMIVTYRDLGLPIQHDIPIKVYYTSYKAKRKYMEGQGVMIDVWIDDSPETISGDSGWTDQDRERWKTEHFKVA